MSLLYPLSAVLRDYGDEDINGWTGYTTPTYIKQWYFIDNVALGYVEALTINPSQVPNSFGYSFARQFHGSFPDLDSAKAAFELRLSEWWAKHTP